MGQDPSYAVCCLSWDPWSAQSIQDASSQAYEYIVRPCDRHRLSHSHRRLSRGPQGHHCGDDTNNHDLQQHDHDFEQHRHMDQHDRRTGEQDHRIEQQSDHFERQMLTLRTLLPQFQHPEHQPRKLQPHPPNPQYRPIGLQSSGQAPRLRSGLHQSNDPQPRPSRPMHQEPLPPGSQQHGPHFSIKPSQSDSSPLQPHGSLRGSTPLGSGGQPKDHDKPPQPQGQPVLPRGPSQPSECPSKPHEHPPLTIHVLSYSKDIGRPQLLIPTFKFDVSKLSPPEKGIQERFTGRDPELANTFFNTADHEAQYQAMLADTKDTIRRWRCRTKPLSDEVAVLVGCHAGMHRSVAIAERLAKDMAGWHGPGVDSVRCLHMDLGESWIKQQWRLNKGKRPAS